MNCELTITDVYDLLKVVDDKLGKILAKDAAMAEAAKEQLERLTNLEAEQLATEVIGELLDVVEDEMAPKESDR